MFARTLLSLSLLLSPFCVFVDAADEKVDWGDSEYALEFKYFEETQPDLRGTWSALSAADQSARLGKALGPSQDCFEHLAAYYQEAMKKWDLTAFKDYMEKAGQKEVKTVAHWLGEEKGGAFQAKLDTLRALMRKAETEELTEADLSVLERYLTHEVISIIKSSKFAHDAARKIKPDDAPPPASVGKLDKFAGKAPPTAGELGRFYDNSTGSGDTSTPEAGAALGPGGVVLPPAAGRGSTAGTIAHKDIPILEGETVKEGGGRTLSSEEKTLAKEIYGDKIDTSQVKIVTGEDMTLWGRVLTSGGAGGTAAVTLGNTIYFPNRKGGESEYKFESNTGWFVHEMTHVGQYQGWGETGKGGWGYAASSVWERITKGKEAYSIDNLKAGADFDKLPIEQQAVLVGGYYNTITGNMYGSGYAGSEEKRKIMEGILRKKGLYRGILPEGGAE